MWGGGSGRDKSAMNNSIVITLKAFPHDVTILKKWWWLGLE